MDIVTPDEFSFAWWNLLKRQKRGRGNPKTRDVVEYVDCITAFDIETTRIRECEQSVMYIWQWCFADKFTVIGRTWDELSEFIDKLTEGWPDNRRMVAFVHNLSYEFAFLRGVHFFLPEQVFAIRSRKILKAVWDKVEFRCSYLHSNMSLGEYLYKMGAPHQKTELDYQRDRWPWTELTQEELEYCVNDVRGLVEALTIEMQADGDNLYTFPLTSTGYVRRDAKRAMRGVHKSWIVDQLPDLDTYHMLREAFRGGNCHANRYYAEQIVHNVHSADRSSSYPDVQCNCMFPVSKFFPYGETDLDEIMKLITKRKRAVLARVAMSNVRLRDKLWGCPYLSRDKCRNVIGGDYDNGRILCAEYLETTITDVDLRIIVEEYAADDMIFYDVRHARYGPLPQVLVAETINYYRKKTELKGIDGQEVYYTKAKNKLNSIYGMMAQNPVKRSIIYTQDGVINEDGIIDYYPEETTPEQELLDKSNRRAFLCYQWGCWVTAWARLRLEEGIRLAHQPGAEFLYCDTDSVKYLGAIDWSTYNAQRVEDSIKSGAWADDPSGERHYMGVYEQEHDMSEFSTMGAKKYVYRDAKSGKLICTIAGVGKSAGAKELEAAGGITAFRDGFTFYEAGGLEALYNDRPEIDRWEVEPGRSVPITANVVLRESTYTLGLTAEYLRLLRGVRYFNDPADDSASDY